MIEENRTLLQPGQGIVRPTGPAARHSDYPVHMAHPAFQPGVADQEIKVIDQKTGRPTGQLVYTGGKSIRFPPVLAMDADQEEFHQSQGYVRVGKSDPEAFARAVREMAPPTETHVPQEYPKWVPALGRQADSPEHEAAMLADAGLLSGDVAPLDQGSGAPSISAEVTVFPAVPHEPTRVDQLERQVREVVANQQALADSVATIGKGMEGLTALLSKLVDGGADETTKPAGTLTHGEKVKAGIARKKAEAALVVPNNDIGSEAPIE